MCLQFYLCKNQGGDELGRQATCTMTLSYSLGQEAHQATMQASGGAGVRKEGCMRTHGKPHAATKLCMACSSLSKLHYHMNHISTCCAAPGRCTEHLCSVRASHWKQARTSRETGRGDNGQHCCRATVGPQNCLKSRQSSTAGRSWPITSNSLSHGCAHMCNPVHMQDAEQHAFCNPCQTQIYTMIGESTYTRRPQPQQGRGATTDTSCLTLCQLHVTHNL